MSETRARPARRPAPGGGEKMAARAEWLRLYPFEIAAWLGLASAVLFLRSRGLRIDWRTVEYTIYPLGPTLAKSMLLGIGMYALYLLVVPPLARRWQTARSGEPAEEGAGDGAEEAPDETSWHLAARYLRGLVDPRWLLLTARLWLAIALFTYTYFWLKVCVPLVNARLWDEAFWRLDTVLHLGFSPSVLAVELLRGTGLLGWIDFWYGYWLATVSLSIALLCALPAARARRRFLLSFVLVWVTGAWLYVALPALGPIYPRGEVWSEAMPELPRAEAAQSLLADNYQKVVAGRTGPLRQFNPTRGIAAMPSLHVGVHWLLMLWFRRYLRPLFLPAAVGTFFTFVGSLATGWHYAVDGYVGILLAQVVYWLALKLEPGPAAAGSDGEAPED